MIICHDADGRITSTLSVYPPGHPQHLRDRGKSFIEVDATPRNAYATHWIDAGRLIERPDCPASVSVSGRVVILSDLPAGSTVEAEIEGHRIQVEDSTIEIDEAGPISVIITPPFPFLEARHDLEIE
jgi:hypothetical protein